MLVETWFRFALLAAVVLSVVVAPRLGTATSPELEPPRPVADFLASNCYDCHQGSDAEAGLNLDAVATDLRDASTAQTWVRVIDRVRELEMPPADYGEIDPDEVAEFVTKSSDWVQRVQRHEQDQFGRVRGRRLTNQQLERTLHDLLAIDVPLARLMPDEPRHDGFTNIADAQSMSHFHLETHLAVVDAALDAAFTRAADDGNNWSRYYPASEIARPDPRKRNRDPEMREGLAVVWSAGLAFYARITSSTIERSGWYRITLTASSLKQPADHGVWCSVRSGACRASAPLLSWIGSFEAEPEPQEVSFTAWIPKGHMLEIRPADETLKRAKFRIGQVSTGEAEDQDVPGVALHEMTIEEIHPGGPVDLTRRRILGDLPYEHTGSVGASGELSLTDDVTRADLFQQVHRFARRAFRRPSDSAAWSIYEQIVDQALADGEEPLAALRAGYRAILCSPRFLYFNEPAGKLDGFAIANRISYMLTGSAPDAALRRAARSGKLNAPDGIKAEVERLLSGPHAADFVQDLAAQWLDLSEIGFTDPDRKLYPDFDFVVQHAMVDETHALLQELLDDNASVTELIDSDHTYLNSRLARFYGVEGVEGDELRRVELNPESHRGGLLSHGSILKVTANGTNTSPVLRGVWVSERLLGQPIPPPPENVPAIEPDIRGATTIRELLEKHKSDISCASCHAKIDPPGYALENFDAAGRWRESYRRVAKGESSEGSEIDSGYVLPDGRAFTGLAEFQSLVLDDPRPIARNVAEKLMIYGTGAPMTFTDREVIEEIVDQVAADDFGFRSLVHAVISSPTFLSK